MPFLTNNSVAIHYEVHGAGPPLLLTHGFSSTLDMWRGQIPALSPHFTLILWSMRGHGQTDSPGDPALYSEVYTLSDMAALLDHVVPDRAQKVVVGGLSLGGYMSLAFYRVHPGRVSKLLIFDTGPGFKKVSAREVWNRSAERTAEEFERRGVAVLREASRERSEAIHRDSRGLAHAARGMLAQRDDGVILSLDRIQVPSLIVVGSEDAPFLAATGYMAKKIPGARKVVIEGAGHAANIDRPTEFNKVVLSFLNDGDLVGDKRARL